MSPNQGKARQPKKKPRISGAGNWSSVLFIDAPSRGEERVSNAARFENMHISFLFRKALNFKEIGNND